MAVLDCCSASADWAVVLFAVVVAGQVAVAALVFAVAVERLQSADQAALAPVFCHFLEDFFTLI
jgi:hypothetical protein